MSIAKLIRNNKFLLKQCFQSRVCRPCSFRAFLRQSSTEQLSHDYLRHLHCTKIIHQNQKDSENERNDFEAERDATRKIVFLLLLGTIMIDVYLVLTVSKFCYSAYPFVGRVITWKKLEEYLKRNEVEYIVIINNSAQVGLKKSVWSLNFEENLFVLEFGNYEEFEKRLSDFQTTSGIDISKIFKKSSVFIHKEKKGVFISY